VSGTAAGAVLAAAGLAGQLVATDRRLRAPALAACAAGIVLLAADLLSSPLATLRHDLTNNAAVATTTDGTWRRTVISAQRHEASSIAGRAQAESYLPS